MKSSHKTNKDLCFIIQQLTLDKLFKYDCGGREKKHGFSTFEKCNTCVERTEVAMIVLIGLVVYFLGVDIHESAMEEFLVF